MWTFTKIFFFLLRKDFLPIPTLVAHKLHAVTIHGFCNIDFHPIDICTFKKKTLGFYMYLPILFSNCSEIWEKAFPTDKRCKNCRVRHPNCLSRNTNSTKKCQKITKPTNIIQEAHDESGEVLLLTQC